MCCAHLEVYTVYCRYETYTSSTNIDVYRNLKSRTVTHFLYIDLWLHTTSQSVLMTRQLEIEHVNAAIIDTLGK